MNIKKIHKQLILIECNDKILIDDESIIFDGGANKGDFIKALHKEGINPIIYAYEPNLKLYYELIKNYESKKVHINKKALNNKVGKTILYIDKNNQSSSTMEGKVGNNYLEDKYQVKSTTIEEEMRLHRLDRIDLLKLNIEGGELVIMENIPDSIYKKINQITIQFHPNKGIENFDMDKVYELEKFILRKGYKFIKKYKHMGRLFVREEILNG